MTDLHKFVREFRDGILNGEPSTDQCWMVCAPLESLLRSFGHEVELIEGAVRGHHHYWLEMPDGTVIDPTADQFRGKGGLKMPPVYLGPRPAWYGPAATRSCLDCKSA